MACSSFSRSPLLLACSMSSRVPFRCFSRTASSRSATSCQHPSQYITGFCATFVLWRMRAGFARANPASPALLSCSFIRWRASSGQSCREHFSRELFEAQMHRQKITFRFRKSRSLSSCSVAGIPSNRFRRSMSFVDLRSVRPICSLKSSLKGEADKRSVASTRISDHPFDRTFMRL